MEEYVSNRPNGVRDYCGIGNVIIPRDQDKAKYIRRSYKTGTASIVLENGGIVDNVLISKSAIRDLDFPSDYKTLGSQVVWINKPGQNQPIIIGIFSKNNEFTSVSQSSSSLRKSSNKGTAEVMVDSDKGVIIVNCSSFVESGGDIYIISTNKNKNSKLSVNVSGSITVETPEFSLNNTKKLSLIVKDTSVDDKVTTITYEKGVGFSYLDEFNNSQVIGKDGIQLKPVGKLKIGEGAEAMMLSQTFLDIFNDFTDSVKSLADATAAITVVATAFGSPTSIPANAASIKKIATDLQTLKDKYKNFQSKTSFTD